MASYSPIHMSLATLDSSFVTAINATIPTSSTVTYTCDSKADAYLDLAAARALYRFETDAVDLTDIDNEDIKFYTDISASELNMNPTLAIVKLSEAYETSVGKDAGLVYHDFIRHLAAELFGRHEVADLFNNERALKYSLFSSGDAVRMNLEAKFNAANGLDTSDDSDDNIVYSLLKQMLQLCPERFENTNDSTLFDASLAAGTSSCLPFVVGDKLSFKLTIYPNPSQATDIFGASTTKTVAARSYEIITTIVNNGNADSDNADPNVVSADMLD